MTDALLLTAALLCSTCGMTWLALAMKTHWQQARGGGEPGRGGARTLRVLGTLMLAASLWLCLSVDHVSMASLVWVMALAASALSVAFALSLRPRWLAALVFWLR